jgi:DNA-binding response OmpR family regulator
MTKKILIVDFDLSSIDQLSHMLDDEVFDISTATSGEMAWDMLTAQHFDLVISEIVLPRLHGFQLVKAVADELPHCRSLVVSGVFKGDIYRNQAIQLFEASYYLEKPLDKIQLKKRVAALLDIPEEELSGLAPEVIEEIVEEDVEEPVEETIEESAEVPAEEATEEIVEESLEDVDGPVEETVADIAEVDVEVEDAEEVVEEVVEDVAVEEMEEVAEEEEITIEFSEHTPALEESEPEPVDETEPAAEAPQDVQEEPPAPSKKNMDIDAALDAVKNSKSESGDYKKIDSEISKKIEDVLSDLGLKM